MKYRVVQNQYGTFAVQYCTSFWPIWRFVVWVNDNGVHGKRFSTKLAALNEIHFLEGQKVPKEKWSVV